MATPEGIGKAGYQTVFTGTVRKKVGTTENGYIALQGDTAVSNKNITFNFGNSTNDLEDNNLIFEMFAKIIGGAATPLLVNGTPQQTVVFKDAET